jgi:hypothetical protein
MDGSTGGCTVGSQALHDHTIQFNVITDTGTQFPENTVLMEDRSQ